MSRARAVVIGAGISGLVTAYQLAVLGLEVTVLEERATIGGAIASHTIGGLTLNAGAEAFATGPGHVQPLLDELGLESAIVDPHPGGSWVVTSRGAHPLPGASLLGIPADPSSPAVRAVIGDAAAERALEDAAMPPEHGLADGVTLGEFVRTRMGADVVTHLVEPVVGGVHSTDPDLLELASIAPALPGAIRDHGSLQAAVAALRPGGKAPGSAVAALAPGMHLLPATLADRLRERGGTVRIQTAAVAIGSGTDSHANTAERTASRLAVTTAAGDELPADAVVVATPADRARTLLGAVAPDAAARIPSVPVSPVRLVTLVVDHPRLADRPRGNGALVAAAAGDRIGAKALTHATAKWPHLAAAAREPGADRHVLRLSYGRSGEELPETAAFPARALADASAILGVDLDGTHLRDHAVTTWAQAMTQSRPGHRERMRAVRDALRGAPGIELTGSWIDGTGIAALVAAGRQTARRTAGALPERITT